MCDWAVLGEGVDGKVVVVADLVDEQRDGEVVVLLVGSVAGQMGEQEAELWVLEGRALEDAASEVSVQTSGWGQYGPVL